MPLSSLCFRISVRPEHESSQKNIEHSVNEIEFQWTD